MTAHSNPTPSRSSHAEVKPAPSKPSASTPVPDSSSISASQASVFLKLGITGPRRPVDDVIDHLRKDRTGQWLSSALQAGPMTAVGSAAGGASAAELLASGKATLEQCSAIKEKSKKIVKNAISPQERLGGIAGYFISIAAGLRHHDVLLTTHDRDELAGILLDLAEVAPEPFATLLSEAALAHSGE